MVLLSCLTGLNCCEWYRQSGTLPGCGGKLSSGLSPDRPADRCKFNPRTRDSGRGLLLKVFERRKIEKLFAERQKLGKGPGIHIREIGNSPIPEMGRMICYIPVHKFKVRLFLWSKQRADVQAAQINEIQVYC